VYVYWFYLEFCYDFIEALKLTKPLADSRQVVMAVRYWAMVTVGGKITSVYDTRPVQLMSNLAYQLYGITIL